MSATPSAAPRELAIYSALTLLLLLVWLSALGSRPLFNPDEGRYAEIPREMLDGGDWVIPHLNGLPYIEKPPLQYWATALSYRLLGERELGARLYCGLCAFGTLACVWFTARARFGANAGWRAAAVLAGMLMFVALGQLLTLDMSLTLYMTLSLTAFLRAQSSARPRRWMLLAWAAAGFGVLTKGVVAAAIPAAVLMLYSAYSRDFSPWRRLHVVLGLSLLVLIAVPWHWLAARRDPGFLEFFFVHEHLARYLTPSADREEPWWFFGGVFLAGTVPWTASMIRVLRGGWRRSATAGFDPVLFLWIWMAFIVVFFSLSDSKLMPYILPAMPALALLIAALPERVLDRDARLTAWLTAAAGVALGLACLEWHAVISGSSRSAYFAPLAAPLLRVAVLLAVSGAYVLLRTRGDATRASVFLGVGWALAWLLIARAAALVAPVYSGIDLAKALSADERIAAAPTQPTIYSIATYDQSLTFYLRRIVTLVAYRGELDYGLGKRPAAEIGQDDFQRRWPLESKAYAIMEKDMFEELRSRGLPMRVLWRNEKRVLVARQ